MPSDPCMSFYFQFRNHNILFKVEKGENYKNDWENDKIADFNIILRHEKDGAILYQKKCHKFILYKIIPLFAEILDKNPKES